jgi:hypothetical protein
MIAPARPRYPYPCDIHVKQTKLFHVALNASEKYSRRRVFLQHGHVIRAPCIFFFFGSMTTTTPDSTRTGNVPSSSGTNEETSPDTTPDSTRTGNVPSSSGTNEETSPDTTPDSTRTGADGKKRPAKQGKKRPAKQPKKPANNAKILCEACAAARKEAKTPKTITDPEPANHDDDEPWVDAWGIPITKEATSAFANADKFDELIKVLRSAKKLFKELADIPGGQLLQQAFVSANTRTGFQHNGLETCIMNVADCKPKYTVCPYAYCEHQEHDKTCTLCRGLGWIGAVSKSTGPPESLINAAKKAHGV